MTSPRRPLRRPRSLSHLILLAPTASALSLANFQLITSNDVPSTCILVYDSQIPDCKASDFTNGNLCSADCVNGLAKTSSFINLFCSGVNVNSKSLLGLTLRGKLIDTLCPSAQSTTLTVTVQPSTTQGFTTPIQTPPVTSTTLISSTTTAVIQPTTSIPSPPATTVASVPATTQTSAPEQTTDRTTESTTQKTTEQTTAQTTVQTTAQTTKVTSAVTSAVTSTVASSHSSAQSPTTQSEASSTTTLATEVTGGGSPFDAVPAMGIRAVSIGATKAILAAMGLGIILLR
ncbi:uncharacterized protein BCR38DRAFT_89718 [Pseudomassariella vexata]|uniref:Extracellular membrane protein CFEM domain-containing protein n=1 Tax=Pseudomassariella vexata TaxID=1141098 RepID=A0A1Y2EDL0_9PEZI|nr:uncharacterized protein BCR38DRAFT_89718 [Pseudomassariella vexata]ORY69658.1 hypothetical protein BCR38DRAFT_89718 [Pseudomassariella vexata]